MAAFIRVPDFIHRLFARLNERLRLYMLFSPPGAPNRVLTLDELNGYAHSQIGLRHLCDTQAAENQFVDFKLSADGYFKPKTRRKTQKTWEPVEQLMKDASAFANHLGGYLIIGVRDANDSAVELVGVEDARGNAQRLRDYLSPAYDGEVRITPPLRNVAVDVVALEEGRGAVIVRVDQRKFGEVHRVVAPDGARVYVRHDDSIAQLAAADIDDLVARDPADGYVPRRTDLLWRMALRLPDMVTFMRPVLALIAASSIILRRDIATGFWLYYSALWTDVLDGLLARSYARVTGRGKELDRWADIFCNALCGSALVWHVVSVGAYGLVWAAGIALALYCMSFLGGWIDPHTLAAKLRSGIVRGLILPGYIWVLPERVFPVSAAASLAVIAGIYEGNIMYDEHLRRRRPMLHQPPADQGPPSPTASPGE